MIKNFKKLFATILALTFSLSCIANVPILASESYDLSASDLERYRPLSASAPASFDTLDSFYWNLMRACGITMKQGLSCSKRSRLQEACERAIDPQAMRDFLAENEEIKTMEKLALILTYLYDVFNTANSFDYSIFSNVKDSVIESAKTLWEIDLEEGEVNPVFSHVAGGKVTCFQMLFKLSKLIWEFRVGAKRPEEIKDELLGIINYLKTKDVLRIFYPILDPKFKEIPFYKYYDGFMKSITGKTLKEIIEEPTDLGGGYTDQKLNKNLLAPFSPEIFYCAGRTFWEDE